MDQVERVNECETLSDDEFVEQYLLDMDTTMIDIEYNEIEHAEVEHIETKIDNNLANDANFGVPETSTNGKVKRRSNLTEFSPSQTVKRKNECAKRELTSIVKQVRSQFYRLF